MYENGDVYDRYRVRVDEMRESTRIVEQCLDRLEGMEGEPWIADDRKVVLPPREELHTSMESLIHHFKLVTEGYRVPEGEVYVAIESPRGELGCYVVSDGGPRPWRVKFRAPSFVALEATATCMRDALVADMIAIVGSLDTVMGEVDRCRNARFRPQSRRGALPASPLGRDGGSSLGARKPWRLAPPRSSREVADALDLTPAHVEAVATFYDMYNLEPVGRHLVEVCTNLSCALVGAQAGGRRVRGASSGSRRARRPTTARSRFS